MIWNVTGCIHAAVIRGADTCSPEPALGGSGHRTVSGAITSALSDGRFLDANSAISTVRRFSARGNVLDMDDAIVTVRGGGETAIHCSVLDGRIHVYVPPQNIPLWHLHTVRAAKCRRCRGSGGVKIHGVLQREARAAPTTSPSTT